MTDSAPSNPSRPAGDRIAKLLARAGIASRREIERMIAEGRVAIDGVVLDTPATILRSLTGVTVDGKPVDAPAPAQLFVYHKTPGTLVTEWDPAGRPTIYDRLPKDLPRLMPVGRLDLATEGLLLMTSDGGLKRELELPATGVERTYRARAYGEITQAMLEELIEGVEIEGMRYGSIDANLERRTGANVWIELTLTEGKNREVRRVLEYLGLQVSRLIRTRYGPFVLGDLPPGEIGEVRQNDLVAFRQTLGPRRAKGADLGATVEVTARPKEAAPKPVAEPKPAKPRPAPVAPKVAASAKPAGWGTRTRPNAARPVAQQQPQPVAGSSRAGRGPRPEAASGAGRSPRTGRTDTDPRREREDGPQGTAKGAVGGRGHPPRPSAPGKGPSGGRGHPPRGGKPGSKSPPRGGQRGGR
ncbi:pseudouridine synthase [Sphingomonas sp. 1P08PE]|uniref:pseudouridine synthase n=1 Tax=Sphingomonas sp. 1P08PE TaxID=554122 RepID=UPI0039A317D3